MFTVGGIYVKEDEEERKKEAGLPFLNKYNCLESTAIQPNHFQPCSNRERKKKRKEKKTVAGIISPSFATCERFPRMLLTSKQNEKKKKSFHWEETV